MSKLQPEWDFQEADHITLLLDTLQWFPINYSWWSSNFYERNVFYTRRLWTVYVSKMAVTYYVLNEQLSSKIKSNLKHAHI